MDARGPRDTAPSPAFLVGRHRRRRRPPPGMRAPAQQPPARRGIVRHGERAQPVHARARAAARALPGPGMGYREQALKILPHICARCAREFEGKRLRELTVHHKDGDHHNNPPDGSNWELLCIYCHENEHARIEDAKWEGKSKSADEPVSTHRPLSGLSELLKKKK